MKRSVHDIRALLKSVRKARHSVLYTSPPVTKNNGPWKSESPDYLRGMEAALQYVLGERNDHFDTVIAEVNGDA